MIRRSRTQLFAGATADRFERLGQKASVNAAGAGMRGLRAVRRVTARRERCDAGRHAELGRAAAGRRRVHRRLRRLLPHDLRDRSQLALGAGRGQGLLLVDGDLELTGGVDFTGLIMVRGAGRTSGQGNTVTGALLVENRGDGVRNSLGGRTLIQYSSCAVAKALAGAASVAPLTQRSWVQIYWGPRGADPAGMPPATAPACGLPGTALPHPEKAACEREGEWPRRPCGRPVTPALKRSPATSSQVQFVWHIGCPLRPDYPHAPAPGSTPGASAAGLSHPSQADTYGTLRAQCDDGRPGYRERPHQARRDLARLGRAGAHQGRRSPRW